MNPIKMLALDLDDTVLRSDLTISYHTRNVIKKAEDAGVIVVLASGRVPAAMERFAHILGMDKRPGYLVCGNGTIVQESHTNNILHERHIDEEVVLKVYDLVDAEGFPVQIYEEDCIYVSHQNEYTKHDEQLSGMRQVVVENFRGMMAAGNCHKIIIPGDPALLVPLEKLLRNYLEDEATIFTSKPYLLEILPAETNKGSALAWIAEKIGIKREEVMAIGDSMNDEAMIRWAGTSVAMINGDERIKSIAAIVTEKTNDEEGVAEIIEKYILAKGA